MKKSLTVAITCLSICLIAGSVSAQGEIGSGGQAGGGAQSDFQGRGGDLGEARAEGREGIVDNRAAASTQEGNFTLGGGQGAGANNMNFLNALFGGSAGNQNVNQNTPLRGRGIRAPFRLGFKFQGMNLDAGIKNLNARIVRIPKFKNSKITGVLQERTLLLVGEVSTPEEASLAVRIARFEPGVDQVKSLLTVAEQGN